MIRLKLVMLTSHSFMVSMVLILWGVGPIIRNTSGIQGQRIDSKTNLLF